jgi:hypothetical protein
MKSRNDIRTGKMDTGNYFRVAGFFQRCQRSQEPYSMTFPECSHNQTLQTSGMESFLSAIEDVEFIQTSIGTPCISLSTSPEEFDPFHSDWPYWDQDPVLDTD